MSKDKEKKSVTPAITLILLAPLVAEVLPGATRFSSLMVFPIEVCVWGGGALLIRYAVRKWQLGWINMLFLALALSIAEEFLIQQTSLAPMVIQIKGVMYARAFGVNYVYFLWALIYESVFVVFIPVYLSELIFPSRRGEVWISKRGIAVLILLFLIGSVLAWYSWTKIARITVFHLPAYTPPFALTTIAVALIGFLIYTSIGPIRNKFVLKTIPLNLPASRFISIIGCVWAILLYGVVLLAFGISPSFPPLLAVVIGILLAAGPLYLLPRWTSSSQWQSSHTFAIFLGVMSGSMMAGFIGFIGATTADLYFKIIVDILALVLIIMLGYKINKMQNSVTRIQE